MASPAICSVEAETSTLEAFLPQLVTAVCDDVQRITDQCLSSGLISDSGRRRILEWRGSEDQARELIQRVQNNTKTDGRCFEIFLDCLDKELPRLAKERLLTDVRKYLEDMRATQLDGVIRRAIESQPASQSQITRFMPQGDPQERIQQQSSLFGRYENSVKNYAYASAERTHCEELLKNKEKESEALRSELKRLDGQNSEADESKEIESTKERLSACEVEIAELSEKVKKLEDIIREEDMQARRGKSIIIVGTKKWMKMAEHALKEKEEECKRLLKEKEDELLQEEKAREQAVVQAQAEDEWERGKSTLGRFSSQLPIMKMISINFTRLFLWGT